MKTMIFLDNIGFCGFNYDAINEANRHTESLEEICFATKDITNKLIPINTAVYLTTEATSFQNGVLIAHTIENAREILSCVNSSKKVLYLYDLDWMHSIMMYGEIYDTLNNKELVVICRSESHSLAVEQAFGVKPIVVKTFNLEEIWNLL